MRYLWWKAEEFHLKLSNYLSWLLLMNVLFLCPCVVTEDLVQSNRWFVHFGLITSRLLSPM